MKKILALSLLLGSMAFAVSSVEAAPAASNNVQDRRYQQDRYDRRNRQWRNNERRVRVETRTRVVRVGRQHYRETYQIRYLPNGRTQIRVINRVRIR